MPNEKYLVQEEAGTRPVGIRYDMVESELVVGGNVAQRSMMETILRDYFKVEREVEPKFVQKNKIQYRLRKIKYADFFAGLRTMREHKIGVTPTRSLGRVVI